MVMQLKAHNNATCKVRYMQFLLKSLTLFGYHCFECSRLFKRGEVLTKSSNCNYAVIFVRFSIVYCIQLFLELCNMQDFKRGTSHFVSILRRKKVLKRSINACYSWICLILSLSLFNDAFRNALTRCCHMAWWYMDYDLWTMLKEVVMAYFKVISQRFCEREPTPNVHETSHLT